MKAEGVSFRHAVELLRADTPTVSSSSRPVGARPVVKSTVPKLPVPVAVGAEDRELLLQVVGYYHETLKQSPEALAYLASRGLRSSEMVERFRLGFANRTLGLRLPAKNRQAGEALRGRLTELGVIRASGHEHLNGSLVIPVFDESGGVVEMYGRKITPGLRKGTPVHLYLPGPHRGVWNPEALVASKEMILCESLIDALTFWCAGYRNVTASYGVEGFTADHLAGFRRHGTERVLIAYDRDEAGDRAAKKLSETLSGEGIATYRVQFPRGMDANEYAGKVRPAEKSLGIALRQAEWMGQGKTPSVHLAGDWSEGIDEPAPATAMTGPAEVDEEADDVAQDDDEESEDAPMTDDRATTPALARPTSPLPPRYPEPPPARGSESPPSRSASRPAWLPAERVEPESGKWPWHGFYEQAVAAGVSEELADLGEEVMREAEQHAWSEKLRAECGWNDAGAAMIELAVKDPAGASRRWQHLLDIDGGLVGSDPNDEDEDDEDEDDEDEDDEPFEVAAEVVRVTAAKPAEKATAAGPAVAAATPGSVQSPPLDLAATPMLAGESSAPELPLSARTPPLPPPFPLAASPEPAAPKPATLEPALHGEEVVFPVGDRRYRVRGLGKNLSLGQLRVNVLVGRGESFHADHLDLHAARQRQSFVKQAAEELGVGEDVVKKDWASSCSRSRGFRRSRFAEAQKPKERVVPLSETESEAALALLRDPRLLDRILEDFVRAGVVGEEENKLVGYLAAVSRKLEQPLAVLIQSSSAAGKSSLMDAILSFVPEEERVQYSAMTGQSLFYMGETDLQHKVLAIVEEEGAERASYALKLLQSEGELTIALTGKDPDTGKLVTQEYRVEGPVMIFLTTTAIEIDEELLNRCLVLTVDEARGQTRAIHDKQRQAQTLAGLLERKDRDEIVQVHRNAQRLLRPLLVANPFAEKLTFVDDRTRTRRDHMKYLTLIRTIALLHQYQRPVQTVVHRGQRVSYIEVTREDIAVANRLAHQVLGRSLDELPPQTRRLLLLVDEMVNAASRARAIDRVDYRFTRREVREATGWGNTQLKVHLGRLEEMEYLAVHRGGRAGGFRYELCYDGQGKDGRPFLVGLANPATLCEYDEAGSGGSTPQRSGGDGQRSGETGQRSGSGRPVVGPKSGGGRGDQTGTGTPQKASNGQNGSIEPVHALPGGSRASASYAQRAAAMARTS